MKAIIKSRTTLIFLWCLLGSGCGKGLLTDADSVFGKLSPYCQERLNHAPFAGGTGTFEDRYQICTVEQLKNVGLTDHLGKNFVLQADLDLSGANWTPIGTAATPFSGDFEGGGRTIRGLTISSTGDGIGLFGYVSSPGTIHCLRLSDVQVVGGIRVGALVGRNEGGHISNSQSSGWIQGSEAVGGLIGYNTGILNRLSSSAMVSGATGCAGGLVGHFFATASVTASELSATGNVSVNAAGSAGGLIGCIDSNAFATTIADSYARGHVSCVTGSCGGFVGYLVDSSSLMIRHSYAAGAVSGSMKGAFSGSCVGNYLSCYFNFEAAGTAYGCSGSNLTEVTGISSEMMKTKSPHFDSWDTIIWSFPPGEYPVFQERVY